MPANLSHFAINADDVEATKAFYQAVFGWTFNAWGPPGFFQIQTGSDDDPGIRGAIQERRTLVDGNPTTGMEVTFGVADLDETIAAVQGAGGTLLMDRFTIAGVGHLVFFSDPNGHPVGAMEYDDDAG